MESVQTNILMFIHVQSVAEFITYSHTSLSELIKVSHSSILWNPRSYAGQFDNNYGCVRPILKDIYVKNQQ